MADRLSDLIDGLMTWPSRLPLGWRRAFILTLPISAPFWMAGAITAIPLMAVFFVLDLWAD